jgi:hypothetical protein
MKETKQKINEIPITREALVKTIESLSQITFENPIRPGDAILITIGKKKLKFKIISEKKENNEEKLIKAFLKKNKIYCRCGEQMIPEVFSHTIIYSCPKVRLWNFWNHSISPVFLKNSLRSL